eukprot:7384962-Prymnesium_polylepis.2
MASEVFYENDKDGNSKLGFRELCAAIRDLMNRAGIKTKVDMKGMEAHFEKADTDGDKSISLDEFVEWYNHFVEWSKRLQETKPAEEVLHTPRGGIKVTMTQQEQDLVYELHAFESSNTAHGEKKKTSARGVHAKSELVQSKERVVELLKKPTRKWSKDEYHRMSVAFLLAAGTNLKKVKGKEMTHGARYTGDARKLIKVGASTASQADFDQARAKAEEEKREALLSVTRLMLPNFRIFCQQFGARMTGPLLLHHCNAPPPPTHTHKRLSPDAGGPLLEAPS